jgi:phage-related protein
LLGHGVQQTRSLREVVEVVPEMKCDTAQGIGQRVIFVVHSRERVAICAVVDKVILTS